MMEKRIISLFTIILSTTMGKMQPLSNKSHLKIIGIKAVKAASVLPFLATINQPSSSFAVSTSGLSDNAFTTLGDIKMCKILNGMWQVSGAHGYDPNKHDSLSVMSKCANAGFTTFDLADIYGPAEEYVGEFSGGNANKDCQFFTKWVPSPGVITLEMTNAAIDSSLRRMKTEQLDLLQFHWWDYNNKNYYDAVGHLMKIQSSTTPKINMIGLTNFDTEHMVDLIEQEAPIVSNQVSFSVLDTRPLKDMVPACKDKNVKLLCYGSLLGGFLSENWINKPEPASSSLTNVSLRKYLPWIYYWGGWGLFQELLFALKTVANKHSVSIPNVAVKWVLQQEAVGGAIVGVRLGLRDHVKDNSRVFDFELDSEDLEAIRAVQAKSKNLRAAFGDCGGEYRRRA